MNPTLQGHLSHIFDLSLRASALADALNAIVNVSELEGLAERIAQTLSEITGDISNGLDSVELMRMSA